MNNNWKEIFEKYNTQQLITGKILRKIQGGAAVEVLGEEAFLPWSQLSPALKKDPETIAGKPIDFKILKINTLGNNIIVSRKELLEEEKRSSLSEELEKIKVGQVYDAVIKNVVSYGAFATINGVVDGLIPAKELSWVRFNDINEIVKVNDTLKVKVTHIDKESKRISLSHKTCTDSPWDTLDSSIYYKDATVPVNIVSIIENGLIVALENGCQAFLPAYEVSWENETPDLQNLFTTNGKLEVKITYINTATQKMQCSLKRLVRKPANLITPGIKLFCNIEKIATEGVYMFTSKNQPVFLPNSEISWTKRYRLEDYINDRNQIKVEIISNNKDGFPNIGSIRHMQNDPLLMYGKETKHQGIISGEGAKIYYVNFPDGISGIILKNSLKGIRLSKNQNVKTRVINVEFETRRLILALVLESEFTGNDIMKLLNLKPCREVGLYKDMLTEAVNEGRISTSFEDGERFIRRKVTELNKQKA